MPAEPPRSEPVPQPVSQPVHAEAQRVMTICNACRYCEGYCAVFPAMARRLNFAAGDLDYLANLCHNCGECYHACQYAPPHEFDVNVPVALARLRIASYARFAWPRAVSGLFERGGVFVALALAASLTCMLLLIAAFVGELSALVQADGKGNFYRFLPHQAMVAVFGAVGLFVVAVIGIGVARFWREAGESFAELLEPPALGRALNDAARLTYLRGGGTGCETPGVTASRWRRPLHHLTFYGFLLCFAATSVATVYHYALGSPAPYAYLSVPVVLGTVGGIALVIGSAGLLALHRVRDAATTDAAQAGVDAGFTLLLLLTASSGLLLLALRETAALGLLLVVHLGIVAALFVTLPYGKFMHAPYRLAALLKYALERKRPHHGLGGD